MVAVGAGVVGLGVNVKVGKGVRVGIGVAVKRAVALTIGNKVAVGATSCTLACGLSHDESMTANTISKMNVFFNGFLIKVCKLNSLRILQLKSSIVLYSKKPIEIFIIVHNNSCRRLL